MKVTWSWGVSAGMSPELAVPSHQLGLSFLRRLFGEYFVVFFLSKTSVVVQILNKCSGKGADGLNTHSQPEDLPIKPGSLICCSLPFSSAEAILLGEKEKSCAKAARKSQELITL